MVSINPADGGGRVSESGSLNFQQQIETTKKYINSVYAMGQDGFGGGYNDPNQIDTRLEKNTLENFLGQFKTWFNREKDNLTPEQINEVETLIAEQEEVLENCVAEDNQDWWAGNITPTRIEHKLTNQTSKPESKAPTDAGEWKTPEGTHEEGTVMKTVKREDGSYYEEYKNINKGGRTYIGYDAEGNRTSASWSSLINDVERPTRKEWIDSEGKWRAVNIEYDEEGNIVREYED